MISLADISSAVFRVLPCYDVREAYLFGSFARGEQAPDSDIDLRLVCGDTMTFGTLYELSLDLRRNLGERLISSPTHLSECTRPFAKTLSRMRCDYMKRSKRDKEITDTIPQLIPHAEPNTESLEAIHESDAFFAKGNPGRFDNAADLIDATLKAPEV